MRAKAAAAILLTQPFPPMIYYGDELGMRGIKGNFGSDAQQLLMIGDKVEFTGNTRFKALPKEFLPRTLLAARVVE